MSTIRAGQQITLDPADKRVIVFDWDAEGLASGVGISTSTYTITTIQQNGVTALTKDSPSILTGSRKTQVRLIATTATLGDSYQVNNEIVTNESPAQTIEQSYFVRIEQR